jgi:hypothetical protein
MKLELLETDSLSNKGVAKNIVVSIDGRRIILPIKTTLQGLLELVRKAGLKPQTDIHTEMLVKESTKAIDDTIINATSEIQKEDIVKCVRVLERAQGADVDIRMGGEYRVLGMKKIVSGGQTVVEHYEVVDDNAPVPRRVMVSPVEVVLLRKHVAGPKKVLVYEEIFPCECGEPTACTLDSIKNKYIGQCKCGKVMERERPAKAHSGT